MPQSYQKYKNTMLQKKIYIYVATPTRIPAQEIELGLINSYI
jgi:hypothetical protein